MLRYRLRRLVSATGPTLTEIEVAAGERIDGIAARELGNPLQWWRIADANAALDPAQLCARPGRRLIVPVPQP